ncbi:hypothetical protein OF83DRAFT_1257816 [Amylostereum chailletii]|nr:hypothetical protein OF83DRAFT_1257816 [Amylostereum chailletii]
MARSTRRSVSTQLSASDLSTQERLLFSQAIHACGADDWVKISQILSVHPLIAKPKQDAFTPEVCQTLYVHLIQEAELESSDADKVPRKGPTNLKLAQKFYQARVIELRELIAAEEAHFKIVAAEIDEIRSGAWDDRIRERLGLAPANEEDEAPTVEETLVEKVSDVVDIDVSEGGGTPPIDEVRTTPIPDEGVIDLDPTPPPENSPELIVVDSSVEADASRYSSPATELRHEPDVQTPRPDVFLDTEDRQAAVSVQEGPRRAHSPSPQPESEATHHVTVVHPLQNLSPVAPGPEVIPEDLKSTDDAPFHILAPSEREGEHAKEDPEREQGHSRNENLTSTPTSQTPDRATPEPADVEMEDVGKMPNPVITHRQEDAGMGEAEGQPVIEEISMSVTEELATPVVEESATLVEPADPMVKATDDTNEQVVIEDRNAVITHTRTGGVAATGGAEGEDREDHQPVEEIVAEVDDKNEPELARVDDKIKPDATHIDCRIEPEVEEAKRASPGEETEEIPEPLSQPEPEPAELEVGPEKAPFEDPLDAAGPEAGGEAMAEVDAELEVKADAGPSVERDLTPKAQPSPRPSTELDDKQEETVQALVEEELGVVKADMMVDPVVDVKDEEYDGDQPAEPPARSLPEDTEEPKTEPTSPEATQPDTEPTPGPHDHVETLHDYDIDMEDATPEVSTPSEFEQAPTPAESRPSRGGKRKASEAASEMSESSREKKKAREQSQSVEEDRPSPSTRRRGARYSRNFSAAEKKFQSFILMLHNQIYSHRSGNIFHNPIKPTEAPDYHDIVKRPIDLKTIKARVRNGTIATSAEYQRDVFLMFANSMMYNRPNSDIYNMAADMMSDSVKRINDHITTEGIIKGRG